MTKSILIIYDSEVIVCYLVDIFLVQSGCSVYFPLLSSLAVLSVLMTFCRWSQTWRSSWPLWPRRMLSWTARTSTCPNSWMRPQMREKTGCISARMWTGCVGRLLTARCTLTTRNRWTGCWWSCVGCVCVSVCSFLAHVGFLHQSLHTTEPTCHYYSPVVSKFCVKLPQNISCS